MLLCSNFLSCIIICNDPFDGAIDRLRIRNITKAVAEDEACHTVDFNITLTGFFLLFFQHLESMSDARLSLSEMEPYFSYYPDKLYKNLVETRVIYNGVLAQ